METRTATEVWTQALLHSLPGNPSPSDLITVTRAAFALQGAPHADGGLLRFEDAFDLVVGALYGEGEFRHSVAAKLPVFDLSGYSPIPLDAAPAARGGLSPRQNVLCRVLPGPFTLHERTRHAVHLGVHKRGVSAAFNLPLSHLTSGSSFN